MSRSINVSALRNLFVSAALVFGIQASAQVVCYGANCPAPTASEQTSAEGLALGQAMYQSFSDMYAAELGVDDPVIECVGQCFSEFTIVIEACKRADEQSTIDPEWFPIECNSLLVKLPQCRRIQAICNDVALQSLQRCILPTAACVPGR